jgi:hypothetical protein
MKLGNSGLDKSSTDCRDDGKDLLDYVIRQFHLIFGTAE